MKYSDVDVRPELTWDVHRESAPSWLLPYLEVPADAAPPMAVTPVHPESVGSLGPEVVEWVEAELGVRLRWWQRYATVRQYEHDEAGRLVFPGVLESASRRVGKSLRLRGNALWRIAHPDLFGEPQLAVHCGKDLAIVREIQRGAWTWAEARDWRVVRAIGRESIENGDHRWLARSTDGVYGYDINLGYVDEAWAVDPPTVTDGIEPAQLERVSPQLVQTSTAHRKATSLMRGRIREALLLDDGMTLLLLWSAPDGADMGDPMTWRLASAHWSAERHRLIANKWAKALAGQQDPEFDDPDPMAGFLSQYLNRWQLKGAKVLSIFPTWEDLAAEPVPALALGVAADRAVSRFVLVGGSELFVDLMTPREFEATGPLVPAHRQSEFVKAVGRIARERALPVGLQEKAPAWTLKADLEAEGVRVVPVTMDEFVQGCADFKTAVQSGSVHHGGQPELATAVESATWRNYGKTRVISAGSRDIPELEAAIIARHVATHAAVPFFGAWR